MKIETVEKQDKKTCTLKKNVHFFALENLHNIKEYVIHVGNLKQTLNHELVLKKGAKSP